MPSIPEITFSRDISATDRTTYTSIVEQVMVGYAARRSVIVGGAGVNTLAIAESAREGIRGVLAANLQAAADLDGAADAPGHVQGLTVETNDPSQLVIAAAHPYLLGASTEGVPDGDPEAQLANC